MNPGPPAPVDELPEFVADFWNSKIRFGGLYNERVENAACLLLDAERRAVGYMHVYGDEDQVFTPWDTVVEFAASVRAKYVVHCHNHPGDCVEPSASDRVAFSQARKFCRSHGLETLDEMIFSADFGFYYSCACGKSA